MKQVTPSPIDYLLSYIKAVKDQARRHAADKNDVACSVTTDRYVASLTGFEKILKLYKHDPHPASHPVIREIIKALGIQITKPEGTSSEPR